MIDPGMVSGWFDAYANALTLYARQLLPPGSAEDVVQDVFARLVAQIRAPKNAKAWLFRSVRNAAISELRSRSRRRTHERSRAWLRLESFESRAGDLIDARAAQKALESLPSSEREVVVLRIWADMTLAEIAKVVRTSAPTVLRRYRRALEAIRERMKLPCETETKTRTL